jgi:hypothetical protein
MSTHTSDANDRRLKIARTVYDALIVQNPDRQIKLRDGSGRVLARNALSPNEDAAEKVSGGERLFAPDPEPGEPAQR